MSLNCFSPMKWVAVKNNYLKLNRSPLKLKWTLRTVKLNKGVDCKIKEIPETSERGPVPQLGVCPDLIVQLNFAFPEFSFAHPQNVELSKSQSRTWQNANKIAIKPQNSEYRAITRYKQADANSFILIESWGGSSIIPAQQSFRRLQVFALFIQFCWASWVLHIVEPKKCIFF